MSDTVIESVISWIEAAQTAPQPIKIKPSTPVTEKQLLDSLQIMDLVMYLESTFEISVPLDALTESNFATPRSITSMVNKIKAGA